MLAFPGLRAHLSDLLARRANQLMMILGLTLYGCTDGYSSADEALILLPEIKQVDAVAAMNQIGRRDGLNRRWQYSVDDRCVLTLRSSQFLIWYDQEQIALLSAETLVQEDSEREFSVHIKTDQQEPSQKTLVLEGARKIDASQLKWLIDRVTRLCPKDGSL